MAAFVAGGLAVAAPQTHAAAALRRKTGRSAASRKLEALAALGGGNVALMAGLLMMPVVVGMGLATDPDIRAGGRADLAATGAKAPPVVAP